MIIIQTQAVSIILPCKVRSDYYNGTVKIAFFLEIVKMSTLLSSERMNKLLKCFSQVHFYSSYLIAVVIIDLLYIQ